MVPIQNSTQTPATDHGTGIALAVAGVLILSFDALLIRLSGTDSWTISFWRGAFLFLSLTAVQFVYGWRETRPLLLRHWKMVALLALLYGIGGALFVASISFTSTANTVVILSSSAFFAALFSRLLMNERVRPRTWIAIGASITGVLVVFSGSFGKFNLLGDILALVLAANMGLLLSLMRRCSHLPRIPIIALSGLAMLTLALPFAHPGAVTLPGLGWLALMGLVQIPLAAVLLMNATRYLSSPEVSLFLLIETVLGPLWVWGVQGEQPPGNTLLGGLFVIGAIAVHSLLALREHPATG
ncbi:MAG: EamA family transporter [Candidatus Sedimenticola endophacoides]|uniref:EamA/RhaT family transporter n=1 Tax=Candidatus Sedimenticola endophacoides TaxID=2548426 RepID=A0A657PUL9_9GAMM|nr:MAG: EamA family transporter [Candidatus Sedimenticola endophacoides]OQX39077.1 MAG: EamA family transporter [Candidatus Sedimenticola endophacoides]OQX43194.1 MAG: EamA family transporter [Candidatus Sedimenticola endophacoides]OQX45210.1 MAG: EamA family transporter [Candidatus Sedimenticola endophacoides]OQX47585.1 MAG: EamA family transporter [Candidatus Sedimenticola endophacoides]